MNVRPAWPRPPLGVRGGSPPPPEPPKAPEAVEPGAKSTEAMVERHGERERQEWGRFQDEEPELRLRKHLLIYLRSRRAAGCLVGIR
jgi:hypothetical protein